ncbi:LOW QUALITY PROTEIN: transmembrane protein 187 [Rhynchonycteris naso]
MQLKSGQALCHVAVTSCLCMATVYTGVYESTFVRVGYEHYAEAPVASLPTSLVPFNSLINTYVLLIIEKCQCPRHPNEVQRACYLKDVFAGWPWSHSPVRLQTVMQVAAVFDQWPTLLICARSVSRCLYLEGWELRLLLTTKCLSLFSYGLALLHPRVFEVALGVRIAAAVGQALHVHRCYGSDGIYLVLEVLSLGFVVLQLCDHQLAWWHLFLQLTGHFSKVCDLLQFHFAFLFLTKLNTWQKLPPERKCIKSTERGYLQPLTPSVKIDNKMTFYLQC